MEKSSVAERISTKEFPVSNHHRWWKIDTFCKPKRRKPWVDHANHQHQLQGQIASERRLSFVFGGIKRVLFTINFSNLMKLLIIFATDNKWSIWTMHWAQNVRNQTKNAEKLFCYMTPHHKNCQEHFKRIQLRCGISSTVFAKYSFFRLLLAPVDLAEQHFANFKEKNGRFMVCFERKFLSSRNSSFTKKKMGKFCNVEWRTLEINSFNHSLQIEVHFSFKNPHFIDIHDCSFKLTNLLSNLTIQCHELPVVILVTNIYI